jgi:transposase
MESTGCYWKPVWQLLEGQLECWLLNAAHLHNVPGRKTDVADAAWIAQLVEHGLVRPSFVPPRPIRELRELTATARPRSKSAPGRPRGRVKVIAGLDWVVCDRKAWLPSIAPGVVPGRSGRT